MTPRVGEKAAVMGRDVVVVGASAGGVESLKGFVAGLAPDLPATVLVVLHVGASSPSLLPAILDRAGPLPASAATTHEPLRRGHIVVAQPDHHLLVVDDHSTLTRGPHENGSRPAIDVLFRSAARAAGPRVIGVILSGALDDGTAGMTSIRQRGGLVLAQRAQDAAYPSMPSSVITHVGADRVGSVAELAAAVNELTRSEEVHAVPAEPSQTLVSEVDMAHMNRDAFAADRPGSPSGYSCPDCSGTLFEIDDDGQLRFRCRVGHAWSSLALMAAQSHALESALWMSFRSLEEKAALSRQLADRAGERGNPLSRQRYLERATEASRSAALLQRLLEQPLNTIPVEEPFDAAAEEPVRERHAD